MTMRYPDFQGEVVLLAKIHYANTNLATELQAVATALASDTTTHDRTIQTPPAGLLSDAPAAGQSRLTRDLLTWSISPRPAICRRPRSLRRSTGLRGFCSSPATLMCPMLRPTPRRRLWGRCARLRTGNWAGTPSSYAYAWYRNGVAIGGATAASYTLVSADIGGKQITAVVTATNVTGSTAAPPSNAIAT